MLIAQVPGMACVNQGSQFCPPLTHLSTSEMNHTGLYSPATIASLHYSLAGTHLRCRVVRRLSWPDVYADCTGHTVLSRSDGLN